jgi:hypothetical protein
MNEVPEPGSDSPPERPWIALGTTYDIEAWIDNYNRELQYTLGNTKADGYGICFRLEAGGEIYLHTNGDGDIMLDVLPEAQWVAPLITAATAVADPGRQFWALPGDCLTQLLFGLSSLIATTRIVLRHEFRSKK